ncbi:acetolactate synthase large subunit [Lentisalinibacter orientalis]|uniref:acetolactate synthase large subunit n=1 Tax=Lentisalinibacter orientalis TaxID=2992241 RepID=UPI003864C871
MNGAESLLRTLLAAGVEVCFTNPGTSEMQFVAALDRVDGMRSVLALFEGVVSGAADGYGRMRGVPAATLLHLGPGMGNAFANFHNARRAHTPIVNIIGEHATWHRELDAPLTSDIEGVSRPVSDWVRTCEDGTALAGDAAEAVAAATAPPGGIATLIMPADLAWQDGPPPGDALPAAAPAPVDGDRIRAVARALASGEPAAILVNGPVLRSRGLELASRVANASGARLLTDTFVGRQERGAGRAVIGRLPYFAEEARETLAGIRHLVLVNTREPVTFFAYPGVPSRIAPEGCQIASLAEPGEDGVAALEALADELGAGADRAELAPARQPGPPTGDLGAETLALAIAAVLPENAIVSDESATSGGALLPATANAPPHDWLMLTGGSIGQGLPVATGAAIACPDRKVLALQADGGGMYTLQSLWTQAREGLNVTNVIFANRQYRILNIEFMRVGAGEPGPKARDMLDIGRPDLDWVALAEGMGVTARRATTLQEFNRALADFVPEPGPNLIELVL